MTNPNDAVGTNAAYNGRTSVNAFNDDLAVYSRGVISGWACSPNSGLTVSLGGNGTTRDVAVAEDNAGNKTSINNISGSPISVTISAAPANNSRIDVIVAYVDNPATGTSTVADNPAACGLIVVKGTAAASPVAPTDSTIRTAITADGASGTTAYYVVLAKVTIASGTTDLTSSNITAGASATITSNNIDFATFNAYGSDESQVTLSNTMKTICSATVPADGTYFLTGAVRASTTESVSGVFNCWNTYQTSGSGSLAMSKDAGLTMSRNGSNPASQATIPVVNVITNAKAGDVINLQTRINTGAARTEFAFFGMIRIA